MNIILLFVFFIILAIFLECNHPHYGTSVLGSVIREISWLNTRQRAIMDL